MFDRSYFERAAAAGGRCASLERALRGANSLLRQYADALGVPHAPVEAAAS